MPKDISPVTLERSIGDGATHPRLALLSNGQYSVIITAAGAGASMWRGLDVTRWREDATRDCWGQFCYVRDLADNKVWSVGYQPVCCGADEHKFDSPWLMSSDREGRCWNDADLSLPVRWRSVTCCLRSVMLKLPFRDGPGFPSPSVNQVG
jgi:hypothetical protein